jgi:hypothetical protein
MSSQALQRLGGHVCRAGGCLGGHARSLPPEGASTAGAGTTSGPADAPRPFPEREMFSRLVESSAEFAGLCNVVL